MVMSNSVFEVRALTEGAVFQVEVQDAFQRVIALINSFVNILVYTGYAINFHAVPVMNM